MERLAKGRLSTVINTKRARENPPGHREPGFVTGAWGPFLESPDDFSGPESYFMRVKFTLKIQLLLVFKAKQ